MKLYNNMWYNVFNFLFNCSYVNVVKTKRTKILIKYLIIYNDIDLLKVLICQCFYYFVFIYFFCSLAAT